MVDTFHNGLDIFQTLFSLLSYTTGYCVTGLWIER